MTMRLTLVAGAMSLLATPSFAVSEEAKAILDRAADACTTFENGAFSAEGARTEIAIRSQFGNVTGELIDESAFTCSSAASLYCGSGGCMVHMVVQGTVSSWQATGWKRIEWGPDTVFLLGRDGGWCGASGAEVCYEAVTWSDGRWLTLGPDPRNE